MTVNTFVYSMIGMFVIIQTLLFIRSEMVFKYRKNILRHISLLTSKDISDGRKRRSKNLFWRYDAFNEVSYETMMWQFWKPLSSFYKGYDFNITS